MTQTSGGVLVVRPFHADDQAAARELIIEGLAAHFGFRDETLNRDLDDITTTFAEGAFFVATIAGAIAGTGGLHVQADGTANIVRMSTSPVHRRRGVGRALLARLIDESRARRCHRITLATGAAWEDAVGFYRACGFAELLRTETGVVFVMALATSDP